MAALKFSTIIKSALTGCGSRPFDRLLLLLAVVFSGERELQALQLNKRACFTWPKSAGVYVIRKKGDKAALYIGAVGHVRGKRKRLSAATFRQRSGRWTPYCFDNQHGTFRFGPKGKRAQSKDEQLRRRYISSIDFRSLDIFCFPIAPNNRISPTAVESLLLQLHLEQHGQLPEANQQF